jgi:hypothetical protein
MKDKIVKIEKEDDCVKAAPELQVPNQIEILDSNNSRFESLLRELSEKIAAIIFIEEGPEKECEDKKEMQTLCPLADKLRRTNITFTKQLDVLSVIINSLQI